MKEIDLTNYQNLISDLNSKNPETIINAAIILGKEKVKEVLPSMLRIFAQNNDHGVMDALAVALSYMAPPEAVPLILEKISDPKNENHRGSLVYSMQFFDCRPVIVELSKLACDPNYEVRHMAVNAISELKSPLDQALKKEALEILNDCLKTTEEDIVKGIRFSKKIIESL